MILHQFFLRRVYRNRRKLIAQGQDGDLKRLADAFVHVETARFAMNTCMFLAGAGILIGGPARILAYLLAVVPVISMAASTYALRGFD